MAPDLERRLATTTRFAQLVHVASCPSTMDLAAAAEGEASGVFWADEQTAGRGRQARSWHGDAGRDVEVTFRIRGLRVVDATVLAAAVPTAFALAVESLAPGIPLRFKWPNDLVVAGQKLGGVLIDVLGNPPHTYLIGVGINVNRSTFPRELEALATSLALTTGRDHDRGALVLALAQQLEAVLSAATTDDLEPWIGAFRSRLGLVGEDVILTGSHGRDRGRLTALDFTRATLDGVRHHRLAFVTSLRAAARVARDEAD